MPESGADATSELAATLRQHRLANGLSFRELAKRLGLSAHSGLSDYEHGRRIPPADLVTAYERVFDLPAGTLKTLRDRAFQERAESRAAPPQPPDGVPRFRLSRFALFTTAGVVVALAAVLGVAQLMTHQSPASPVPRANATTSTDLVDLDSRGHPQRVRRHGSVVLDAGHVIDLDSTAGDWAGRQAPSDNPEDVEFTLAHRTLTGIDNAVLGVLPHGSKGWRSECGRLQAYGVEAGADVLKPGTFLCVETDQHRYALLRVTAVRDDGFGRPDQVGLDIIVWDAQVAY